MKRLFYSLILIAMLASFVSSCTLLEIFIPHPSESTARIDEVFELVIGERARVIEADLLITFVDIVEDSRCPVDVVCVWPGNAKVLLEVQEVGRTPQRVELNSSLDPREVFFGSYRVDMMGIQPPKRSTQSLRKDDYVLSLVVKGLN